MTNLLCGMMKIFKLYFLSTSLFTANSTLYKDLKNNQVAVTHEIKSEPFKLHHELTVLYDQKYHDCFLDEHQRNTLVVSTPNMAIQYWKAKPKNEPRKFSRSIRAIPMSDLIKTNDIDDD